MAPTGVVERLTVEQAQGLRRELLARLGVREANLAKVDRYALNADQLAAYDDLMDLDYLLAAQ